MKPALGAEPSIHRITYWRSFTDGEVRLVFSTGFSGLTMRLRLEGANLVGTASTFWDFIRKAQKAKVQATKVPCEGA